MRSLIRSGLVLSLAAAVALAVAAGGSAAAATQAASRIGAANGPATALTPPQGSVFTGLSSGPESLFSDEVGKHPAVYGEFVTWGQSIEWAFNAAAAAHARLMLHISTTQGYGAPQQITPAGIADGHGDSYLLALNREVVRYGRPVYIRLLPEMDQANNAYCAFNTDGTSRGPAYAPTQFVAAWRRAVIVLRGGSVGAINAHLRALGESGVRGIGAGATIARAPVSFVWTPQTAGSPDIAANSPAMYYPGDRFVDWVGTDFYSKFPNFTGLSAFYAQYPEKPFAFGEWAIWGGDAPSFVGAFFAWVDAHPRVEMMLYNQGYITDGPFRLSNDPGSRAAIRHQLVSSRFLATTPEW